MDSIQAIPERGMENCEKTIIDQELEDFDQLFVGDPVAIEENLQRLIPRAKEYANRSIYPQLLSKLAIAQAMQKKFEEAHRTLDAAETIVLSSDNIARVRILLERGRVFHQAKDLERAKHLFQESYQLSKEHKLDEHTCDIAHMLAIIVEEPSKKIEWNLLAIELAKESETLQAKAWLGSLYNNLGVAYFYLGQYQQALTAFNEALNERQKESVSINVKMAEWQIARTLRLLNRWDEAFSLLTKLEKEIELVEKEMNLPQPLKDCFSGYVYAELAEILFEQASFGSLSDKEGIEYARLALIKLSPLEWLVEAEPRRFARLKEIAR